MGSRPICLPLGPMLWSVFILRCVCRRKPSCIVPSHCVFRFFSGWDRWVGVGRPSERLIRIHLHGIYFIVGGVRIRVLATRVTGSILQDFGLSGPPPVHRRFTRMLSGSSQQIVKEQAAAKQADKVIGGEHGGVCDVAAGCVPFRSHFGSTHLCASPCLATRSHLLAWVRTGESLASRLATPSPSL